MRSYIYRIIAFPDAEAAIVVHGLENASMRMI
jgi:hypothetical protein